jgi:hypothetical protein
VQGFGGGARSGGPHLPRHDRGTTLTWAVVPLRAKLNDDQNHVYTFPVRREVSISATLWIALVHSFLSTESETCILQQMMKDAADSTVP